MISSNPSFVTRIKRIFHAKNVVVVSQHAVDHYALSLRSQCLAASAILLVVGAASYSMGRYVNTKKDLVLATNDLQQVQAEHEKISGEYSLLKKDLLKINAQGESLSDYAQFVIEQYSNNADMSVEVDENLDPVAKGNSSNLLGRLDFLERELEKEKQDKKHFMNTIHQITRDKVKILEEAVKITGMEDELSSAIQKKRGLAVPDGAFEGQGGPFTPYTGELNEEELEQSLIDEVSYLATMSDVVNALPIASPMPNARRTSGYGKRRDPFHRGMANHTGIDFAGSYNSRVLATATGRVVYAGYKGAYGKTVTVSHGHGITSQYSHMSRIDVRVGQYVSKGTSVGRQGSTGRSTGQHLHYEVRYHNRPLDPSRFLNAGYYVQKKAQEI
jgi:murein DD-endopeptidase MepM/ murein hydrolase activator NlpD